jgi:hypothetical protein
VSKTAASFRQPARGSRPIWRAVPVYITPAELDFARRHQGEYAIYRVFDVDSGAPEFYTLEGDLDILLTVEPVTYRACPA